MGVEKAFADARGDLIKGAQDKPRYRERFGGDAFVTLTRNADIEARKYIKSDFPEILGRLGVMPPPPMPSSPEDDATFNPVAVGAGQHFFIHATKVSHVFHCKAKDGKSKQDLMVGTAGRDSTASMTYSAALRRLVTSHGKEPIKRPARLHHG